MSTAASPGGAVRWAAAAVYAVIGGVALVAPVDRVLLALEAALAAGLLGTGRRTAGSRVRRRA